MLVGPINNSNSNNSIHSNTAIDNTTEIPLINNPLIINNNTTAMDSSVTILSTAADEYRQYPIRWIQLAIFALLTITNAILWISFAPIQKLAEHYYSVNTNSINLLSIIYMALYLPGYILATTVFNRYGLRNGLLLGGIIQLIGSWIRYISIDNNAHSRTNGYYYLLLGQCCCGLVQPIFTNSPAKLANDWFNSSQRNLATTIAAMSNPLGIAIGQLLPSIIVTDNSGMPLSLLIQALLATITVILAIIGLKSQPITPPSRSAAMKLLIIAANNADSTNKPASLIDNLGLRPVLTDVSILFRNKYFRILSVGVGIGLGLFNALSTLIYQITEPAGYSSDDAGIFGALLIVCGFVGAGIIGPLMDYTKKYNLILKCGILGSVLGTIFMLSSIRPNQTVLLTTAWGILGFTILPLLPVCMECAVECTYPINEDSSSGLMLLIGNIISIILIFILNELIQLHSVYSTIATPAAAVLISIIIFAAIVIILFYNGPTLRLDAENNSTINNSSEIKSSSSTITTDNIIGSTDWEYNRL